MNAELLKVLIMMHFSCVMLTPRFNCKLPIGCEINEIKMRINNMGNDKTSLAFPGIVCDIRNETFRFDYPMPTPLLSEHGCYINDGFDLIEFRFPNNFILDYQINFPKILKYMEYFSYEFYLSIVNIKGFELNITYDQIKKRNGYLIFQCIQCKIEFYSKGRHIKTCQDILDEQANSYFIWSLFQIKSFYSHTTMIFFHSEYKTTLCPLVFKNSDIVEIRLVGLVNTFFKRLKEIF